MLAGAPSALHRQTRSAPVRVCATATG